MNNATTLNFNALLVSDELQAQRVVPQLQAFNRAVPEKVMVFSLAGSLQMPGIPTIPAIEYSMDAMASRIVNWLIGKSPQPGGSLLRGDLIIPERWGNKKPSRQATVFLIIQPVISPGSEFYQWRPDSLFDYCALSPASLRERNSGCLSRRGFYWRNRYR